jgi:hypothetical protein
VAPAIRAASSDSMRIVPVAFRGRMIRGVRYQKPAG